MNPIQQPKVLVLCPDRDCDRNGQCCEANDREAGNREHKIPDEPVEHFEMLSAQRESPLQQQEHD
jgi:hypothetical protein